MKKRVKNDVVIATVPGDYSSPLLVLLAKEVYKSSLSLSERGMTAFRSVSLSIVMFLSDFRRPISSHGVGLSFVTCGEASVTVANGCCGPHLNLRVLKTNHAVLFFSAVVLW